MRGAGLGALGAFGAFGGINCFKNKKYIYIFLSESE